MKQLILLGGPMGVGKSAVSEALLQRLTPGVYLDGDWCWHMQPFVVNDENKRMVLENITHVLRGFLRNTGIDYVIFCWVMHQEAILHQILRGLQGEAFEAQAYSLLCDVPTLTARIQRDVERGLRDDDCLQRSLQRMACYNALPTMKVDTTHLDVLATAQLLEQQIRAHAGYFPKCARNVAMSDSTDSVT